MKKAAIYVRVSGEYQTVERQIKELTEYAEKNNYEIAKVFEEKISAYKELSEREKLLELFTYVENKECDVVLFSEFTRLARTVSELLLHIDRLRNCGVELYFQKQNLWVKDVSDYSTSILINVLGVISEYEVELFVSRSISGKINAFQNRNIAWGNSCPYGYTIAKGTKELVVDKDEASIVVDIFEMYLKGKSTMDIADYLNVNDIKPPFFRRYKQSSERR
ncbi:MAG: recombinase family protein, partial [Butyricimonas faecihominis]